MITNINRSWSAVVFGVTTLSAAVLLSQTASPPQTEEFKSDEYLILGSPNRGAGEPMVVVNPKDSNNIIVVAMATLNRLPTGETPLPRGRGAAGALTAPGTAGAPPAADPARTALRIKELSTPDGSRTDIAVTHDGGKTWQFSEDNFRKMFSKNRCSDSFAGAGPDGTLYLGCLAYLNRGDAAFADGASANGEALNPGGGTAIAWSTDKGRTWSDPKYDRPRDTSRSNVYSSVSRSGQNLGGDLPDRFRRLARWKGRLQRGSRRSCGELHRGQGGGESERAVPMHGIWHE